MGGATKIEWTDQTDNPIIARSLDGKRGWFCTKVSEGCKFCYSERMNLWRGNGVKFAYDQSEKVLHEVDVNLLARVSRYRNPRRIFVCNMTDLFGWFVPLEWILGVIGVYAGLSRSFNIQFLTKDPERMGEVLLPFYGSEPLPHFWLGFSAENQETFDARWPHMLKLAKAGWKVWCSMEPLLGPIKPPLEYWLESIWTVAGGESGPNARPSHPDWFRYLRDVSQEWQRPFFFKQWGEWAPRNNDHIVFGHTKHAPGTKLGYFGSNGAWHEGSMGPCPGGESRWPGDIPMNKMGRRLAGHLLDGHEWRQFPTFKRPDDPMVG